MLIELLNIFTSCFFWSTLLIGFFIIKGGFYNRFLFIDNPILAVATTIIVYFINSAIIIPVAIRFLILIPFVTFILFILLSYYRFFRNPNRKIKQDNNHVLSPADGRIIYIREVDDRTYPVSIKKKNMIRLDEITKTDMLKTPCYLIGIAMTLFDVHYNRSPIEGSVKLIQHTDGVALGLRNPESTFINERNTFVIENATHGFFGVVQIAAKGVRRCISTVVTGDTVMQGQMIGKIRFGSQVDLIIPRKFTINVREGDQVYAGLSVIAKMG